MIEYIKFENKFTNGEINTLVLAKVNINENENQCQIMYHPGYNRVWLNDMKKGYDNLVERFGADNITIIKPAFGYYYPYEN